MVRSATMREWIRSDDERAPGGGEWKPDWARLDAAAARVARSQRRVQGARRVFLFGVGLWLLALAIGIGHQLLAAPDPPRKPGGFFDYYLPSCGGDLGDVGVLVGALGFVGFVFVMSGFLRLVLERASR